MSAITDAIVTHKAAWQAFQDAPGDDQDLVTIHAADAEDEALERLLATIPETVDDVTALEAHLRWLEREERELREGIRTYDAAFAVLATIDLARSR